MTETLTTEQLKSLDDISNYLVSVFMDASDGKKTPAAVVGDLNNVNLMIRQLQGTLT